MKRWHHPSLRTKESPCRVLSFFPTFFLSLQVRSPRKTPCCRWWSYKSACADAGLLLRGLRRPLGASPWRIRSVQWFLSWVRVQVVVTESCLTGESFPVLKTPLPDTNFLHPPLPGDEAAHKQRGLNLEQVRSLARACLALVVKTNHTSVRYA